MSEAEPDYRAQIALVHDEFDRLGTRLRSLSRLAWLSRRPAVEALLTQLEAFTAAAELRPTRAIPAIPDHALADALAVFSGDALVMLERARDQDVLDDLMLKARTGLAATR
jgi:hypothetical protein